MMLTGIVDRSSRSAVETKTRPVYRPGVERPLPINRTRTACPASNVPSVSRGFGNEVSAWAARSN